MGPRSYQVRVLGPDSWGCPGVAAYRGTWKRRRVQLEADRMAGVELFELDDLERAKARFAALVASR